MAGMDVEVDQCVSSCDVVDALPPWQYRIQLEKSPINMRGNSDWREVMQEMDAAEIQF